MHSTVCALLLLNAWCKAAAVRPANVEWTEATPEPGQTQAGRDTYQGSMPLGNGGLTAQAWANVTAGGVFMYVGHQNAQSSHTELFKIARLEILVSPNPFTQGYFFSNKQIITPPPCAK